MRSRSLICALVLAVMLVNAVPAYAIEPTVPPPNMPWWSYLDAQMFEASFQAWEAEARAYHQGLTAGSSLRAWSQYLQQNPLQTLKYMLFYRDNAVASGLGSAGLGSAAVAGAAPASVIGSAAGLGAYYFVARPAVDAFFDKLLGKQHFVMSDGQEPTTFEAMMDAIGLGEDVFFYREAGWLRDASEVPEELAWMFPEWSYESTAGNMVYSFTPAISAPAFSGNYAQSWKMPPHNDLAVGNWRSWPWSIDAAELHVDLMTHFDNPTSPLRPYANPSSDPNDGAWTVGVVDLATGNNYSGTGMPFFYDDKVTNGVPLVRSTVENPDTFNTRVAAFRAWVDAALANPAIEASEEMVENDVAGVEVPTPDPRDLPGALTGDFGGLTLDDPLWKWLEAFGETPDELPGTIGPDNGIDPERDRFKATIGPAMASLRWAASNRWPFAGFSVLSTVWNQAAVSSDPVQWYLNLNPWSFGDPVGVWIRPLDWANVLAPYRWVFRAAIGLLFFGVLFSLLRPRIEV